MNVTGQPSVVEVPARSGRAVRVGRGDRVRIVDVRGGQVGDVFAFAAPRPGEHVLREHLSAAHTRAYTSRLLPELGDSFVTNQRRPILRLEEDLSPGHHDMLIAACDPPRYAALGQPEHESCAQNLHRALEALDLETPRVPQPVNVFMHIPVTPATGALEWLPATTAPGDSITFTTEMDCVVAVSACPQDLAGINASGLSELLIETSPAAQDEPPMNMYDDDTGAK